METSTVYNIVIPIYEGVDLLDVTVPYEVFNWVQTRDKKPATKVYLVGQSGAAVKTRDGFTITPECSFEQFENAGITCNLIWVPGGDPANLEAQMKNTSYTNFIIGLSKNADYVTSVCEGALLLANAGLLTHYKATTHWAFIPCLKSYPGIYVQENVRFVVDGNRVTGGGVSSGLDECFELIILIFGQATAEAVQKTIQYYPDPPLKGKVPEASACPSEGLLYGGLCSG